MNPLQQTHAACAAIAAAFGPAVPYAIVGGAACVLLGSQRSTIDVDVVVPQGHTPTARSLLANSLVFRVERRTRHTFFVSEQGEMPIEILAPPRMFMLPFSAEMPTTTVNIGGQDVRVLDPTTLLNGKLLSLRERSTDAKRMDDREDVLFLLSWLAEHSVVLTRENVPAATVEYVQALIEMNGGEEVWAAAGWPW